MQLFRDVKEVAGNGLVLFLHFFIDRGDPVNRLTDAVMNITIGDALCQFCQFLGSLALQFCGHTVLGDPVQQPLNIGCGPSISCTLIAVIQFCAAALRCRYLTGLLQRNTASLLVRHHLM